MDQELVSVHPYSQGELMAIHAEFDPSCLGSGTIPNGAHVMSIHVSETPIDTATARMKPFEGNLPK